MVVNAKPRGSFHSEEQHRGHLAEANCSGITPEGVHEMKKRLIGRTIHVIGPRKLENELLVSYIRTETGAECFVTDFNEIEKLLVEAAREPHRLFLIDYRDSRLREILKMASLNGNGSPLGRRLISLFSSGKSGDASNGNPSLSACGILCGCDSAAALLNWMWRLFNGADSPMCGVSERMEAVRDRAAACPLTWRELQLLMLMTEGLRNHEIASRLGISSHTVRTHLYNSFAKIGARNRLEASAWIEAHINMLFLLI
jgi:DNA-binding CsgD family transcriptional regulator